jgi:hypothetical protein
LSDLVSANGRHLIQPTLNGIKLTDRKSTLAWPEQHRPPLLDLLDWTVWATTLGTLLHGSILKKSLGMPKKSSHQQWFWYIDAGRSCPPPSQPLFPTMVQTTKTGELRAICSINPLSVDTPHPISQLSTANNIPPSVLGALTYHPFYDYLYNSFSLTDDQASRLAAEIQGGALIACCNGSYDPISKSASYGMVFGITQLSILRVSGTCPGHPDHHSALCSELASIVASECSSY